MRLSLDTIGGHFCVYGCPVGIHAAGSAAEPKPDAGNYPSVCTWAENLWAPPPEI